MGEIKNEKDGKQETVGNSIQFKSVGELKEFLGWCRNQKMQQVTIGDMLFVFSPLAYIDNNADTYSGRDLSEPPVAKHVRTEDDDDLFYSATPNK